MPEEVCVSKLSVPVGATVLMEILRRPWSIMRLYGRGNSFLNMRIKSEVCSMAGSNAVNLPRSMAMSIELSNSAPHLARMIFSVSSRACVESKDIPSAARVSPNAVKPRPVRRPFFPFS